MKFRHLKRYKDIALLILKYGRSEVVKELSKDLDLGKDEQKIQFSRKEDLIEDLQKMGPTFVKLGQLLSTETDILPEEIVEEMSRLQDRANPFSYEEVEEIFRTEFKVELKSVFKEFNKQPIAAASLAQVHHAILPSGREVAVKIQRPHIEQSIIEDLNILEDIAKLLDRKGAYYGYVEDVRKLRITLLNELDFRKEALNMRLMRANLEEFKHIALPNPIKEYTSRRILTMDFIKGTKITSLDPLARINIDGTMIMKDLFMAYNKQIFLDGLIHIDPHPGNVYITEEGQIALFDLGMVEKISTHMQNMLLKIFLAVSEGAGEDAADLLFKVGYKTPRFNTQKFTDEVGQMVAYYHNLSLMEIGVGKLILKIARKSSEIGIRLPHIFNMLGKTLMNLDKIARSLDPSFNPNELIQETAADLVSERVKRNLNASRMYRFGIESIETIQKLPFKLSELIDLFSKNNFKIRVKASGEQQFLNAFERLANRVALGMVLSALIVGAALLMNVKTSFTIFGYPGLAIILFLIAAFMGMFFIFNILFFDHTDTNDK